MWYTCCALHNLLLEVDGLHKTWEQGYLSRWEQQNIDHNNNLIFAMEILNNQTSRPRASK